MAELQTPPNHPQLSTAIKQESLEDENIADKMSCEIVEETKTPEIRIPTDKVPPTSHIVTILHDPSIGQQSSDSHSTVTLNLEQTDCISNLDICGTKNKLSDFVCQICQFKAVRLNDLADHYLHSHFSCKRCLLTFQCQKELDVHEETCSVNLCFRCQQHFKTKISLTLHSPGCSGDGDLIPYRCFLGSRCNFTCSTYEHLLEHGWLEHTKYLRSKDQDVHMVSQRKIDIYQHAHLPSRKSSCYICQKECNNILEIIEHYTKVHERCENCLKVVASDNHRLTCRNFNCPICDQSFQSELCLMVHYCFCRGKNDTVRFRCSAYPIGCLLTFNTYAELVEHCHQHNLPREPSVPKFVFIGETASGPETSALKFNQATRVPQPIPNHGVPLEPPSKLDAPLEIANVPGDALSNNDSTGGSRQVEINNFKRNKPDESNQLEHKQEDSDSEHPSKLTLVEIHSCAICDHITDSRVNLIQHTVSEHIHCERCRQPFKTNREREEHKNSCNFRCLKCLQNFKTLLELADHDIKCSGDGTQVAFKCGDGCPFTAVSLDALEKHLLTKHRKRQFRCNECGKKFPSLNSVHHHSRKIHPIKMKECCVCKIEFHSVQARVNHEMLVHSNTFRCTVCSERWADRDKFIDHISMCAVNQARNARKTSFTCNECNKKFSKMQFFLKHTQLHSTDQRYSCDFCSFKDSKFKNLQRHIWRKHPDKLDSCKRLNPAVLNPSSLLTKRTVVKNLYQPEPAIAAYQCQPGKTGVSQTSSSTSNKAVAHQTSSMSNETGAQHTLSKSGKQQTSVLKPYNVSPAAFSAQGSLNGERASLAQSITSVTHPAKGSQIAVTKNCHDNLRFSRPNDTRYLHTERLVKILPQPMNSETPADQTSTMQHTNANQVKQMCDIPQLKKVDHIPQVDPQINQVCKKPQVEPQAKQACSEHQVNQGSNKIRTSNLSMFPQPPTNPETPPEIKQMIWKRLEIGSVPMLYTAVSRHSFLTTPLIPANLVQCNQMITQLPLGESTGPPPADPIIAKQSKQSSSLSEANDPISSRPVNRDTPAAGQMQSFIPINGISPATELAGYIANTSNRLLHSNREIQLEHKGNNVKKGNGSPERIVASRAHQSTGLPPADPILEKQLNINRSPTRSNNSNSSRVLNMQPSAGSLMQTVPQTNGNSTTAELASFQQKTFNQLLPKIRSKNKVVKKNNNLLPKHPDSTAVTDLLQEFLASLINDDGSVFHILVEKRDKVDQHNRSAQSTADSPFPHLEFSQFKPYTANTLCSISSYNGKPVLCVKLQTQFNRVAVYQLHRKASAGEWNMKFLVTHIVPIKMPMKSLIGKGETQAREPDITIQSGHFISPANDAVVQKSSGSATGQQPCPDKPGLLQLCNANQPSVADMLRLNRVAHDSLSTSSQEKIQDTFSVENPSSNGSSSLKNWSPLQSATEVDSRRVICEDDVRTNVNDESSMAMMEQIEYDEFDVEIHATNLTKNLNGETAVKNEPTVIKCEPASPTGDAGNIYLSSYGLLENHTSLAEQSNYEPSTVKQELILCNSGANNSCCSSPSSQELVCSPIKSRTTKPRPVSFFHLDFSRHSPENIDGHEESVHVKPVMTSDCEGSDSGHSTPEKYTSDESYAPSVCESDDDDSIQSELEDDSILSGLNDDGVSSEMNDDGVSSEMNEEGVLSELDEEHVPSDLDGLGIQSEVNDSDAQSECNDGIMQSEPIDRVIKQELFVKLEPLTVEDSLQYNDRTQSTDNELFDTKTPLYDPTDQPPPIPMVIPPKSIPLRTSSRVKRKLPQSGSNARNCELIAATKKPNIGERNGSTANRDVIIRHPQVVLSPIHFDPPYNQDQSGEVKLCSVVLYDFLKCEPS